MSFRSGSSHGFRQAKTPDGHLVSEATSAMQKSIRRGLERDALYWASEIDAAGYPGYCWKRLQVIATEDVGLADSNVAVQVRTLYETWREYKAAEAKYPRIWIVHAVLILARAPKSRIVDHAGMVIYEGGQPKMEMPDYALDKHTRKGRTMGRGMEWFFDDGALLVNETLEDPYKAEARALMVGKEKSGIQARDDRPAGS